MYFLTCFILINLVINNIRHKLGRFRRFKPYKDFLELSLNSFLFVNSLLNKILSVAYSQLRPKTVTVHITTH